jgi:hypothetical protein
LSWQEEKESAFTKVSHHSTGAGVKEPPARIIAAPPPAPSVVTACKKCAELEKKVLHLEGRASSVDDSIERLVSFFNIYR